MLEAKMKWRNLSDHFPPKSVSTYLDLIILIQKLSNAEENIKRTHLTCGIFVHSVWNVFDISIDISADQNLQLQRNSESKPSPSP